MTVRLAALIACLIYPALLFAEGFSNSLWVEIERETDCKFILEFHSETEYFVLNTCPMVDRETGIRETGRYILAQDRLMLESRIVMWKENLFNSAEPYLVLYVAFENDKMTINENENISRFKRVDRSH